MLGSASSNWGRVELAFWLVVSLLLVLDTLQLIWAVPDQFWWWITKDTPPYGLLVLAPVLAIRILTGNTPLVLCLYLLRPKPLEDRVEVLDIQYVKTISEYLPSTDATIDNAHGETVLKVRKAFSESKIVDITINEGRNSNKEFSFTAASFNAKMGERLTSLIGRHLGTKITESVEHEFSAAPGERVRCVVRWKVTKKVLAFTVRRGTREERLHGSIPTSISHEFRKESVKD